MTTPNRFRTPENAAGPRSTWWVPYLLYGSVAGLLLYLFYPLGVMLLREWRGDPEFSHGFLIPIVSCYVIWLQRREITSLISKSEAYKYKTGLPLLLFVGLILFVLSHFLQHIFVQGIALIVILAGLALYLYGKEMFKAFFFPIAYLIFMLPIPHAVNLFFANQLKFFITDSAGFILGLAQIPILLEGNMIHLASISLEVVEACSGMQTMISFLAIGSVFAYLGYQSNFIRALILLLAIPMALFANILRVTTIGSISYYFNNDLAHTFHGYAWTLIIFIGVLGFIIVDAIISRWIVMRPTHASLVVKNR